MDKPHQSRAPLIFANVLLLLPVLYVGSYLALVTPGNFAFAAEGPDSVATPTNYRLGGNLAAGHLLAPGADRPEGETGGVDSKTGPARMI